MRVLFLDIDGVLNSSRSCAAFGGYPHGFGSDDMRKFDAIALGLIQRLCRAVPDLRIILSSTWRRDRAPMEAGLALRLPIIDSTPVLNGKRGDEIAHWLAAHPGVTEWAIVDDDSDMLPEQHARFVQTKHSDGLAFADYCALCALFCVSPTGGRLRESITA